MTTKEQWRPIEDHEGYEVSSRGRLRRDGRPMNSHAGGHHSHQMIQVRCPSTGKRRNLRVAMLMLEAFIGPRPDGKYAVNSIPDSDGVLLENLHWDDANARRGRHGEDHHNAKLTNEEARAMIALREDGATIRSLAEHFGIAARNVHGIVTRRTWKHLDTPQDREVTSE